MARGRSLNNIILPIVLVGGVIVVAYLLITKTTGGKEALGTGGRWLKNFTDAIDSTGEAIGSGSKALQDAPGGLFNRLNDWFDADRANDIATSKAGFKSATDSILGTGNAIQQFFGGGTRDPVRPPPNFLADELQRSNRIFNRKAPPRRVNGAVHQKA